MKKRKTLRLFPLLLSVLLFFSLTVPVYASENLDDSVGTYQPSGVYHEDFTTGTTTFIPMSEIPDYDYTCTYDCLPEEVVAQCRALDAQYLEQTNLQITRTSMQPMSTAINREEIVHPYGGDDYLYSGVVLLVLYARLPSSSTVVPLTTGTGFIVGGSVVVTAQHCMEVPDSPEYANYVKDHVKVYFGVDFLETIPTNTLADYENFRISYSIHGDHENYPNNEDWCVAVFNGSTDDLDEYTYIFNCYTADSTIVAANYYSLGYPGDIRYRMLKSHGIVTEYLPGENQLRLSNLIRPGMSGGPICANVGGRSAIAINKGYIPDSYTGTFVCSVGTLINDHVLDVIYDFILNT